MSWNIWETRQRINKVIFEASIQQYVIITFTERK
jgi:hypothetical protein